MPIVVLLHKMAMASGAPDEPVPASLVHLARALHFARQTARQIVDYALPPRCPGCGTIVAADRQFCLLCWGSLEFLDGPACASCSIPLPTALPGSEMQCGACLAKAPPYAGAPAAVAYGPIARTVALRLKYGRRLGHARLMAGLMARHLPEPERDKEVLITAVPLHRWRIWSRGFNQAALIADHIARENGIMSDHGLILRKKATASLRGKNRRQREAIVAGAFALGKDARERLEGRHIVLVDDVHASGATLHACARILTRGGAARVSALTWARVVPEAMLWGNKFDFATFDSDMDVAERTG